MGPDAGELRYRFELDEALTRLHTEICFPSELPEAIVPLNSRSRPFLLEDSASHPVTERGIDTRAASPGSCVRFAIDLEAIEREGGREARRVGGALIAAPYLWLWTPTPRPPSATARFVLPSGMTAAIPWPRVEGTDTFEMTPSLYTFKGQVAWGTFDIEPVAVDGGTLGVITLGRYEHLTRDDIHAWLHHAAEAVADLYDGFPQPYTQVFILPSAGSDVVFGRVTRGGGATVNLLTGRRARPEDLARDWIAVHEMIHLGFPILKREAAWLYEGIATYYGPVLRARAGLLSESQAWARLDNGFNRGRRIHTGRSLRDESANMHRSGTYWRVYWSGAAVAFLADVALRSQGQGRSLDDEIQALRRCCLQRRSGKQWEAEELLEELGPDSALRALTAQHLDSDVFPPPEPAYEHLGLDLTLFSRVQLVDAPGNAIRDAIMRSSR